MMKRLLGLSCMMGVAHDATIVDVAAYLLTFGVSSAIGMLMSLLLRDLFNGKL